MYSYHKHPRYIMIFLVDFLEISIFNYDFHIIAICKRVTCVAENTHCSRASTFTSGVLISFFVFSYICLILRFSFYTRLQICFSYCLLRIENTSWRVSHVEQGTLALLEHIFSPFLWRYSWSFIFVSLCCCLLFCCFWIYPHADMSVFLLFYLTLRRGIGFNKIKDENKWKWPGI